MRSKVGTDACVRILRSMSAADWARFDESFRKQYIRARGFAHGATVVVLNARGVQHSQTFGQDGDDTIYCCFSMTKIVTTIACLQLRDRGLLSLDDPVAKKAAFTGLHNAGWLWNTGDHTTGASVHDITGQDTHVPFH